MYKKKRSEEKKSWLEMDMEECIVIKIIKALEMGPKDYIF